MRMRSPKISVAKTLKGVKMKQIPTKKKKASKNLDSALSETLSVVIKRKFNSKATQKKVPKNKPVKKEIPDVTTVPKQTKKVVVDTKKVKPPKKQKVIVNKKKVVKVLKSPKKITEIKSPKCEPTKRKAPTKLEVTENAKVPKPKKVVPPKKTKNVTKVVKPVKEKPKPKILPKKNIKLKEVKTKVIKEKPKSPVKVKEESLSEEEPLQIKKPKKPQPIKDVAKKRALNAKEIAKRKNDQKRKLKLYSMWTGPKKHRVASLNATAKVHCLYENESRANFIDHIEIKREAIDKKSVVIKTEPVSPPPTRTLRSVPGLRAVGKMWDMHDTTSSDSEIEMVPFKPRAKVVKQKPQPKPVVENVKIKEEDEVKTEIKSDDESEEEVKLKTEEKKVPKRRKRTEIIMDLKDMVVRKRMASLNATAILAASLSVEKRGVRKSSDSSSSSSDSEEVYSSDDSVKKSYEDDLKKEEDRKVIEVRATPNKKVAVILNQDTDVTITGVYVNSTTRSTHHEGYCSIAGMQYRISATSHTQTAATAVTTETILQSASASSGPENSNGETPPSKSYTPLDALSNMQPPAGTTTAPPGVPLSHHHLQPPPPQHVLPHTDVAPLGRRHGCSSAFSAPPGPCVPQAHHHLPAEHGYIQGYYQPAGPLITVPHGHSQPLKSVPLPEPSPSVSPPLHQPPPPSSAGDSSDSEVIITSVTTAKEVAAAAAATVQQPPQQHRSTHYPPAHSTYPFGYPPQYYPAPPPVTAYPHHDIYYPPYSQHKYMYRRYPPQYYQPGSPDLYTQPSPNSSTQQQVVTATSTASGSTFPSAPTGPPPPTIIDTYPPPPPTLVETYAPPPPHYYPGYGPAPPPPCYTHSPPSRALSYINATYQSCPCPIQSCPKNVHTGPLTGDSKRSNLSIAKESVPLPPVALALPLEPASATGPPSPARGSAGMPPPPSPAGATYQPPPPKLEVFEPPDLNHAEKRRKARVGKAMVRNTMAANQNTMLLMCHSPSQDTYLDQVKREVESPKEERKEEIEEIKEDEFDVDEDKLIIEITSETDCKTEEEEPSKDEDLPCVNTVAENVKVKNMKRKLSVTKEKEKELDPKKQKLDKSNGSYKDLIKKTQNVVKINNGKRKLIRFPRKKLVKRQSSPLKEGGRSKQSKPLTASNLHNSKQNLKEGKDQTLPDSGLAENKQIATQTNRKRPYTRKKSSIMDSLKKSNKNNVDRTIESVIINFNCAMGTRTSRLHASDLRTEKCALEMDIEEVDDEKKSKGCKRAKIETRRTRSGSRKDTQNASKSPQGRATQPRWSNGWTWEGEPFEGKVFLNSDETIVTRQCYPAMRHEEGDIIEPGDCVLLKAGQRKNELPFVAKIAALWENPEDGEMMMSLLWYYRPEHTEQGRLTSDRPDEVFASRHKDSNSVACIEDKGYVLTFNEYCRYRKNLKRLEEGVPKEDEAMEIPLGGPYPRMHRQPPKSVLTPPDMVFFCRRVYDFRQKRIVKNPS